MARLSIIPFVLALAALPLCAQEPAPQPVQQQAAAEQTHPFYETGFYPEWSKMDPQAGVADARAAMEIARGRLAAICAVPPGEETWENVFAAYEAAMYELECVEFYMQNLAMVRESRELRIAGEEFMPLLAAFSAENDQNRRLWEVLQRAAAQPWVAELSPAKRRYVEHVVSAFRSGGAELTDEQKARKHQILKELSELQLKFDFNIQGSVQAWHRLVSDPAELAGMPEDWMRKAFALAVRCRATTPDQPKWLLTQAGAGDILSLCTVEETRKACWQGRIAIGGMAEYDNAPVVARIMELRQEYAQLLGFRNYADYACRDRMVDSGDKALAFVDGMMERISPAFQRESQELLEYVSRLKGEKVEALNPWDVKFYQTQYAKQRCGFDPQEVRPYLRYDIVIRGMFRIAERLYGISISEVPSTYVRPGMGCPEGKVEVWAPGVKVFKVTDDKTGRHLGSFYFDPFPRNGKQGGAWVSPVRYGRPGKDGAAPEPHLLALVGNFTAPAGKGPGFFTHKDVDALFHEFGHLLHMVFNETELRAQAGVAVAWDFVELPSQLNENWAWEPEGIALYACHHETGEPMPEELVQKLIAGRYTLPATEAMAQLCAAKQDLELHMHYAEKFAGKPLDDAMYAMLAPYTFPMTVREPSNVRYVKHYISGGYAAGFYSYVWADVLAADAFSRFQKEGVMNPGTAEDFRQRVLRHGGGRPAADLFRDFMGRDPQPDALLEKQGL